MAERMLISVVDKFETLFRIVALSVSWDDPSKRTENTRSCLMQFPWRGLEEVARK